MVAYVIFALSTVAVLMVGVLTAYAGEIAREQMDARLERERRARVRELGGSRC